MRATFVLSEVLTGLRRNITMTVAMILTTAISLATLGGGLLFVRMVDKTEFLYEDILLVRVFLTDDISANDPGCAADPCVTLRSDLEADPAVESIKYMDRNANFEVFKRVNEVQQPELVELARLESLPASFNIKLKDPDRPEVISQTYAGRAGIKSIDADKRFLEEFFSKLNDVRNLSFFTALVIAVAAVLLISNMVQVSAFNRRTEVGIMRLVGATRWYTQLPFLLEAVATGLIGAVLAIGLLIAFKEWFLDSVLGSLTGTGVVGAIDVVDILAVSPWLLLIATGISAVTGYVTLRLYVRT